MTSKQKDQTKRKINLFKEVFHLARDLFHRDFIKDAILDQPEKLRKLNLKLNLLDFIVFNIIFSIFTYMIIGANYLIQYGHPILGMTLFFLYTGKSIISTLFNKYAINIKNEIQYLTMDSVTIIGSKILSKVSFNVYKKKDNFYEQCSNETITNSIARYLDKSWKIQNQFFFNFAQLISVIGLLVITIITNTTIPQKWFIPLLLISSIASFFSSAYDRFNHKNYVERSREIELEKNTIKNDILRIEPIIPLDQEIRIQRLQNLSAKTFENEKKMNKKDFLTDIITSSVHIFASYVLIILTIINTDIITLETIANLTASLAVFNTAINSSNQIIRLLIEHSYSCDVLNNEKELMNEILKTFHKRTSSVSKPISELRFEPFSITYAEQSENDRPFNLVLEETLVFKPGDCVALTGPSGSGKSTLLKLCRNKISFKYTNEKEIAPVNNMHYDETISFGSLSIWDELFCLDEITRPEPSSEDLEKMEYIFKNLFLWKEISENSKDVWTWTKVHKFSNLSNGQKQRIIIAKILFWLSSDIDIVSLDECTSGLDVQNNGDLDNADAFRVLNFILDYCNRDKPRFILISTHQDIGNICNRTLYFQKSNGQTIIREI